MTASGKDRTARVPHGCRALRQLRLAVVVQRRRIEEHTHGRCTAGADGSCTFVAYERGILVGLWRALRELGVEEPEAIG